MQTLLNSSRLKVTINHFGAEVCSIKNNAGIEFMWQAHKDVWPRHAPVLFPIVGRLKDNSYTFNNTQYQLSQHGFARDKNFELVERTENSCVFQLVADDGSKKNYPFGFVFQIHYRVEESTLITTYKVINPSAGEIFFSVGAHPGFNCPLLPGETFEDYYLEFEDKTYDITQLSEGLRTPIKTKLALENNKLFLSARLFDNDALVFENGQINTVSLCSVRSAHRITLACKNWPYFGIWAKKGNTNFICLEPWHGIAGRAEGSAELKDKDGIVQLGAKQDFSCSFSIAIQ